MKFIKKHYNNYLEYYCNDTSKPILKKYECDLLEKLLKKNKFNYKQFEKPLTTIMENEEFNTLMNDYDSDYDSDYYIDYDSDY